MTKLAAITLVLFSLVATPIQAQSFTGFELKIVDGKAIPLIDGQLEKTWVLGNREKVGKLNEEKVIIDTLVKLHASMQASVADQEELDHELDQIKKEFSEMPRLGLFVWFLSNDVGGRDFLWSEIFAGPTWYPRKWLEIAVGAGVETNQHPWRIGGEVIAAGQRGVMIFAWEHGGSGPWYRISYAHHVAGRVSAGVFSRRFAGTGPFVSVKLTDRYSIWAAAGPDLENGRKKTVLGLNIGLP